MTETVSVSHFDCSIDDAIRPVDLLRGNCAATGTGCRLWNTLFELLNFSGIHYQLQSSDSRERGRCRVLTLNLVVRSEQIESTIAAMQQAGLLRVPGSDNASDPTTFVGYDSDSGLWCEVHLNTDRVGSSQFRRFLMRFLPFLFSPVKGRRFRTPGVALLGPDGSGKSALSRQLQSRFYFPVRLLYMGLYGKTARNPFDGIPGLRLAFNVVKQWAQYLTGRYHQWKGRLVVYDRYSYDSLLPGSTRLTLFRRLRRFLLVNTCPAPDLVVLLDAPGQTLFDRKGEHTPEHLERQRNAYRRLADQLSGMVIVDASRDEEEVYREVTAHVWNTYLKLNRGESKHA